MNLKMKKNILLTFFLGTFFLGAFGQETIQKTVVVPLQTGTVTMTGNIVNVPILKENIDESNANYTVILTPISSNENIFVKSKNSDSFIVESLFVDKSKSPNVVVFDYVIFVTKTFQSAPTKIYTSIHDN